MTWACEEAKDPLCMRHADQLRNHPDQPEVSPERCDLSLHLRFVGKNGIKCVDDPIACGNDIQVNPTGFEVACQILAKIEIRSVKATIVLTESIAWPDIFLHALAHLFPGRLQVLPSFGDASLSQSRPQVSIVGVFRLRLAAGDETQRVGHEFHHPSGVDAT